MFKIFKKKKYTDEELFQALTEDEIQVTEQEIQKAREEDPETLYKIGKIYHENKNDGKAFPWFYKAAIQDHGGAQVQIGWLYQCGYGESQDYKLAMEWYQKAASAGNTQGQYYIGLLYFFGHGISRDYKQAINWYLKAAHNGNTDAMNEIGSMYRYGTGITKNIPTAIKWYAKAANQANARAQFNLGSLYQYEDQVKDLQNAVHWFQKAADNGNENAKSRVKHFKDQGYHAREDVQNESSATSSHHEPFNRLIESRVENLERLFQSKMTLMEESNDALRIELASLKQEKQQQHEEIQLLKQRLARIETDDECSHKKINTTKTVVEGNKALQKELATLKQEKLEQFKETKQLRDELAKLKEALEDNNDLNYDSTDDEDRDTSKENKDVNTGSSEENVAHSKPRKTQVVREGLRRPLILSGPEFPYE